MSASRKSAIERGINEGQKTSGSFTEKHHIDFIKRFDLVTTEFETFDKSLWRRIAKCFSFSIHSPLNAAFLRSSLIYQPILLSSTKRIFLLNEHLYSLCIASAISDVLQQILIVMIHASKKTAEVGILIKPLRGKTQKDVEMNG